MFAYFNRIVLLIVSFAVLVLSVPGCNSNNSENDTTIIGPAGGTVMGADGVTVVIPPNALDRDVAIGIERTELAAPAGSEAVSRVYRFTPADLKFALDVTVTIPLSTEASPEKLSFFWTKAGDETVFEAQKNANISSTKGAITIDHFSYGCIARHKYDSYEDIACGDKVEGSTTTLSNLWNTYPNVDWAETGSEKVYRIRLSDVTTLRVEELSADFEADYFLLRKGDNPETLMDFGDRKVIVDCLEPGDYFLVVDGRDGSSGSFSFEVACVSCEDGDWDENEVDDEFEDEDEADEDISDGDSFETEEESLTICEPGETRCEVNMVQICSGSGTSWGNGEDCSISSRNCLNGQCTDVVTCDNIGSYYCNGFDVLLCNDDGVVELIETCIDEDMFCESGACHCHPGEKRCKGEMVQICVEGIGFHTSWEDEQDCLDDGQICWDAACVCETDQQTCDGNVAMICEFDNTWQIAEDCTALGKTCVDGSCMEENICCGSPLDGSLAYTLVQASACDKSKPHFPARFCEELMCCFPADNNYGGYMIWPNSRCKTTPSVFPFNACEDLICCESGVMFNLRPAAACTATHENVVDMSRCETFIGSRTQPPLQIGRLDNYPQNYLWLWPEKTSENEVYMREFRIIAGWEWTGHGVVNLRVPYRWPYIILDGGDWSTHGLGDCSYGDNVICDSVAAAWYYDSFSSPSIDEFNRLFIELNGSFKSGYDANMKLFYRANSDDIWTEKHALEHRMEPVYRVYASDSSTCGNVELTYDGIEWTDIVVFASDAKLVSANSQVSLRYNAIPGKAFLLWVDWNNGAMYWENPLVIESLDRHLNVIPICINSPQ